MGKIAEMLKGLKRGSKQDFVPGTLDEILERTCPLCGTEVHLARMKPCCGHAKGYIWCKKCDYKEQII